MTLQPPLGNSASKSESSALGGFCYCDAGIGPFPRTGTYCLTQRTSGIVRFARTDPLIDRYLCILCAGGRTRGISFAQIQPACAAPCQQHVKTLENCSCCILLQAPLTR